MTIGIGIDIPPPPPPADDEPLVDPYLSRMYARYCKDCPPSTIQFCQQQFGDYWVDKSGGGQGCNFPLAWHDPK